MPQARSVLEEKVVESVRESRDELAGLVRDLVACDTTARETGDPPRDEEKLQNILAQRLRGIGAEVELWEPEPTGEGTRSIPANLDFAGRPQLIGVWEGTGGGRSLLVNSHIDSVTPGRVEDWKTDPFKAVERDGFLYGRGVTDLKGGVAALLFAAEVLHRNDVDLRGSLVYTANTDEESSGAAAILTAQHGVRADTGIVGECTDFDVWVACKGTVMPVITVQGRQWHAEWPTPHWTAGGAVNAIDKAALVLDAVHRLNEEWRDRPDMHHPHLSPSKIVPVKIQAGAWLVMIPPACTIILNCQYTPGCLDAQGTGEPVQREIREAIDTAADADPWLRRHPLEWEWMEDISPYEVPDDTAIVDVCLGAASDTGRKGLIGGSDSPVHAAAFSACGTPSVCFGPGRPSEAHSVDERMSIDELVDGCAAFALTYMRWCGAAGGRARAATVR